MSLLITHEHSGTIREWRPITGFPAYRVSCFGEIESSFGQSGKWRRMSPCKCPNGYYQLPLSRGGKKTTKRIHVLVAEAFLVKPESAECVRHLDGFKCNNYVGNLAWGTYKQNEADKIVTGSFESNWGDHRKLSWNKVREIRRLYPQKSQLELASLFSVSRATITRVINQSIWRESP